MTGIGILIIVLEDPPDFTTLFHFSDFFCNWRDQIKVFFVEKMKNWKIYYRMVIDNIIAPIIEQCGAEVIPEIVRGFEEFRHLQDLADEDLIAQIEWSDQRASFSARAQGVLLSLYCTVYLLNIATNEGYLSGFISNGTPGG